MISVVHFLNMASGMLDSARMDAQAEILHLIERNGFTADAGWYERARHRAIEAVHENVRYHGRVPGRNARKGYQYMQLLGRQNFKRHHGPRMLAQFFDNGGGAYQFYRERNLLLGRPA